MLQSPGELTARCNPHARIVGQVFRFPTLSIEILNPPVKIQTTVRLASLLSHEPTLCPT